MIQQHKLGRDWVANKQFAIVNSEKVNAVGTQTSTLRAYKSNADEELSIYIKKWQVFQPKVQGNKVGITMVIDFKTEQKCEMVISGIKITIKR